MLDRTSIVCYLASMNQLPREKQIQVIQCLVEGNSIRSTVRMTGVAKNTVSKLLVSVGQACEEYQRKNITELYCQHVQCDEIWAYCYAKEKNVPEEYKGVLGYGNVWTFSSMDAESKLIINWTIGSRDKVTAIEFMKDLRSRIRGRFQLTTDSWKKFKYAVEEAFKDNIDYAMIRKQYAGQDPNIPGARYSPPSVIGLSKTTISGRPDKQHVSTSYIERSNLTMRMSMRRFTRLTNGFSKKLENLEAAIALHFMHYNFCRIHSSLRVTPAMSIGLTHRVWDIADLAVLADGQKCIV